MVLKLGQLRTRDATVKIEYEDFLWKLPNRSLGTLKLTPTSMRGRLRQQMKVKEILGV